MIFLNHIGIAVEKPERLTKLFGLLGYRVTRTEPVPEQGVVTHFLPLPQAATHLELLEPTTEGTISKFIEKRGQGIHHLSFQVGKGELEPLSQKLRGEGYRLIYDSPQKGAHSMRVNFIHPASTGGVLIELTEPGKPS